MSQDRTMFLMSLTYLAKIQLVWHAAECEIVLDEINGGPLGLHVAMVWEPKDGQSVK